MLSDHRADPDMGVASLEQDSVNRRVYSAHNISRRYTERRLDPVETIALLKFQPEFANRDVLDLGVGTGRTTRFLAPLARRYVCIDYSPEMITNLRRSMPEVDAHIADIRDLSAWPDHTFDFVFAPNNMIDTASHQDRIKALSEIVRVMRPHGVFMFSSHNNRYREAADVPHLEFSRNPVTQAMNSVRLANRWLNYAKLHRLRRIGSGYSLLNDVGHDYGVLHYYIDREFQVRQLADCGMEVIDVFDHNGGLLHAESNDWASSHLLYVARKQ